MEFSKLKKTGKRLVIIIFATLFVLYFVSLAGALIFGENIMLPGRNSTDNELPGIFEIQTADGSFISVLYLKNPQAQYTILYSHGNGEDLGDISGILEMYRKEGYSIISYDYRGYGKSPGRASEKNVYMDADAVYEYLTREANTPPQKIITLGRSIGSGPACYIAEKHRLAGLIIESGFTSAFRVFTQLGIFPLDKFNNVKRLKKINCPVMIIHGTADYVIPFAHSRINFKAANDPKMYYPVQAAGHNDLIFRAGNEYWQKLDEFKVMLKSHGGSVASP